MRLETEQSAYNQDVTSPASAARGLLFVLSAPSGTGKDSVIQALKDKGKDFHVVASVTTRAPRPGESEGNPYYFTDKEQFDRLIADNALIEFAQVHGNWYGQPIQQIEDNMRAGRDVLLKIDVQGAATVRRKIPDAIYIFLVPGSLEELSTRLVNRHTETPQEQRRRLTDAQNELAHSKYYDYIIVNRQGKLDEAVANLAAIMQAEHCRNRLKHDYPL